MFAIVLYIAAVIAANLTVAAFGPVVTPINAFFLIGLDLSLRDYLHMRWQGDHLALRTGGLILFAGVISYLLNPASGVIALASVIAFTLSNAVDAIVFERLRSKGYLTRANSSNAAGAAVDSLVFPTIVFSALMPEIVLLQFVAKFAGGALWAFGISRFKRA